MNPKEKSQSPIQEAQEVRDKIVTAIETQTPIKIQLSPEISACLFGLPKDLFKKYGFSALIQSQPDGVNFFVADSLQIALTAFRNWQSDHNPQISLQFRKTQYLALYRLLQAIKINQADKAIKGIEGLILKLLEEEDERFHGLSELISKKRPIPDEDLNSLHLVLTQIWENLPMGIRSTIISFSPERVFNI